MMKIMKTAIALLALTAFFYGCNDDGTAEDYVGTWKVKTYVSPTENITYPLAAYSQQDYLVITEKKLGLYISVTLNSGAIKIYHCPNLDASFEDSKITFADGSTGTMELDGKTLTVTKKNSAGTVLYTRTLEKAADGAIDTTNTDSAVCGVMKSTSEEDVPSIFIEN